MKIPAKKAAVCLILVIGGLIINCSGVVDEEDPLAGVYYLSSISVKSALNKLLVIESPVIMGDLTVRDTSYEMTYGLTEQTGDSTVDETFTDKHFLGAYEFIGSTGDSVRFHLMPKSEPFYTDWRYHRTTDKLTLDNPEATQVWLWRFPNQR